MAGNLWKHLPPPLVVSNGARLGVHGVIPVFHNENISPNLSNSFSFLLSFFLSFFLLDISTTTTRHTHTQREREKEIKRNKYKIGRRNLMVELETGNPRWTRGGPAGWRVRPRAVAMATVRRCLSLAVAEPHDLLLRSGP